MTLEPPPTSWAPPHPSERVSDEWRFDEHGVLVPPPPEPVPRRPRRWGRVVAVVAAVALGLLLLVAADWGYRTWKARDLVERIEASEAVLIAWNADYRSMLDEAFGAEEAGGLTEDEVQTLIADVQGRSRQAHDEMVHQRDRIARYTGGLLPWHAALDRTADDYLAHVDAWIANLDDVATTFPQERHFGPGNDPLTTEVNTTWATVCDTAPGIRPWPDPWGIAEEVDAICAGDEPPAVGT